MCGSVFYTVEPYIKLWLRIYHAWIRILHCGSLPSLTQLDAELSPRQPRVHAQVGPSGLYGGECGAGTGFL